MKQFFLLNAILLSVFLAGCTGLNTYPVIARAGDTITLAPGWMQNFSRDKITVTFTPPVGADIIYAPNDPAVRAVINLYPDPVSWLVVGEATNQNTGFNNGGATGYFINNNTGGDRDWWQTTVFLDLPASLPTGTTNITINSTSGETYGPIPVEIIGGTGSPAIFKVGLTGSLGPTQLASLERATHSTISFNGTTIPYSIQVKLIHDPDEVSGGVGRPYVINTRGDIKSVNWSDDGSSMIVMLTPAKGKVLDNFLDFKFYVAGGITGLQVANVQAFDVDGNPVTGTVVSIQ